MSNFFLLVELSFSGVWFVCLFCVLLLRMSGYRRAEFLSRLHPVSWISVCFGASTMLAQLLHVCLITGTTCIYKANGWQWMACGLGCVSCSSLRELPIKCMCWAP